MKPEIKHRWLTALRSGQYQQGHGTLRQTRAADQSLSHCCLGVLCDLYLQDNPDKGAWQLGQAPRNPLNTNHKWIFKADWEEQSSLLPVDVYWWAGIEQQNINIKLGSYWEPISALNDKGWTFAQIADIIEHTPETDWR